MTKLVHKGIDHSRLATPGNFKDTQRERALAAAWQASNKPRVGQGSEPILTQLFKDPTQRDAEVAATIVQWMGSQIGFLFLKEALADAGLEIVEADKAPKRAAA